MGGNWDRVRKEWITMKTTAGQLRTKKLSDLLQEGKESNVFFNASPPRTLKESFPSTFSLILQQNGIDII